MTQSTSLRALQRRRIRSRLLKWYDSNQRTLPWRGERDPYRVWVSEIMLQQTRVNAVKEHYRRFLERFPTVNSLARAKLPAVLAAWSGLGYYRRARFLHEAARRVSAGSSLPSSSDQWRELPGIGRYTAAAIASIGFGERCAVVDGNVERVLSRMLATSAKDCWPMAQQLLSRSRPGDFNQAMMELGATVCLPRTPVCSDCPLAADCVSRGRVARSEPQSRNKRELAVELFRRGDAVWLIKRPSSASLMPNMWELPNGQRGPSQQKPLLQLRHSITTTDYRVAVFAARKNGSVPPGTWMSLSRASDMPLTGLTRKILRRLSLI